MSEHKAFGNHSPRSRKHVKGFRLYVHDVVAAAVSAALSATPAVVVTSRVPRTKYSMSLSRLVVNFFVCSEKETLFSGVMHL